MSVAEMCALAQLSRAGYYRFLTTPAAGDKDIDLRDAIQRIALEFAGLKCLLLNRAKN